MAAISFAGRLAEDPEFRYSTSGTSILALRVPVDTGWGDRKVTTWYRVSAFGKLADRLDSAHQKGYLKKGDNVFVRGQFQIREYDKNDGSKGYSAEVNADDVQIIFAPKTDTNSYGGGDADSVPF